MSRRHLVPLVGLAVLAYLIIGSTAQAATYYWDPSGNGLGGGSKTWNGSTTYWSPNTTGGLSSLWPGTGTQAEFFAGSGTADVASADQSPEPRF